MKKVIICSMLFFFSTNAYSGEYRWKVIKVVDGDTISVEIPGIPEELNPISVRVLGIDTPEKGGKAKCLQEEILGNKASAFTKNFMRLSSNVVFKDVKWDKYGGRIDATVLVGGENLADELVKEGLARKYNGEKKKSWCNKN